MGRWQAQILLAQGIAIERSVLAFWVGYAAAELMPLCRRLRELLLASPLLFVDETRAPVLDPRRGRTKTGYFWSIARDIAAGAAIPARRRSSTPTRPGAAPSTRPRCSPAIAASCSATAMPPTTHQTKKGNQWHFGMKAHIGVDVASGVVHTVTGTAANTADINQTAALLHGQEEVVFADAGYTSRHSPDSRRL